MTANVLVLLLPDGSEARLRAAITARTDEPPNVHVVTPIQMGALAWLASDEDEARAEASVRAFEAERLLGDEADVEGEAGDADPVQAVEDALRTFPADEILIVGGRNENGDLEAALRRFELPVTRLGGPAPGAGGGHVRRAARSWPGGARRRFVFVATVNLTLLLLAFSIAAIVMLVVWLR